MKLSDFDYHLPEELIAVEPANPRDSSRLLVLSKDSGRIEHRNFYGIVDYLNEGDLLIINDSKVFPARLLGKKERTGGALEVFLLKKISDSVWQCLIGGRGARPGLKIELEQKLTGEILKNNNDGTWDILFSQDEKKIMATVFKIGKIPLPPYIEKNTRYKQNESDKINYQTVYANQEKIGSVAAPTAGLHFTWKLLEKIKAKGIGIEKITLHVGMGTFAPVKTENILEHKMHAEWLEIKKSVLAKIIKTKQSGGKIIAVGTTSARALETAFQDNNYKTRDFCGWTDIFIYPGFKFKIVDAMITNFHLPKSTLLMLVSAFAGQKNIDLAYQKAIEEKYRFYSYGDAMLII